MTKFKSTFIVYLILSAFGASIVLATDVGTISCGETASGEITTAGQEDTWTFEATAGDRILLSVKTTSGALYPYVIVYAPDASQEAAAYQHINQQMTQTGTYTVVTYDGDTGFGDVSLDDTGSYNITFLNLEGCSWSTISCNETLSGTIDAPSDMEVWQFSAAAGERVLLSVKKTSGALYPYVIVYGPDGSMEDAAYQHINQQMTQTGTYTVVIYDGDTGFGDVSLDDTGSYNITFLNLEGCSWSTISCNETLSGTIDAPSDMEVWQFSAAAGERVLLSVKTTSGTLYPYVIVYAPDGSQEAAAYQHLNQQMTQTGTFTVVIYDGDTGYGDISLDDTGEYNITFLNLEGCSWPSISCNETLSGSIDAHSDMEVWQFSAAAGDSVMLSVITTSGALYPYVIVYAPDGSQEAAAYQHINQPMSQTGTFTVVIYDGDTGYGDISLDDTGEYDITLTCDGTGETDLLVSSLTISQNPVVQFSGPATVSWTVKNGGTMVATPTGYSLQVRLSADDSYDESDSLIGQTQIDMELLSGETVSGTYSLEPNDFSPGDYFLVAMVDTDDIVDESSENNNTASTSVSIVEPSQDCKLTITATEGGTVISPGEGLFTRTCGTSISIEAMPESYYKFTGWTGTAVDTGLVEDPSAAATTMFFDPEIVCIGTDYTLVANFEESINPPEVETVGVSDLMPTSALLHGEIVSDGGEACDFLFRYWKADETEYYKTAWDQGGITGETFSMFIADLSPATTYYFETNARNSEAYVSGSVLAFTTPVGLTVSATKGGTVVNPNLGINIYPAPIDVNIVAEVIDPNYYFWCWQGTASDAGKVKNINQPETTVDVDADDTLRAAFLKRTDPFDDLNPAPCRGAEASTSQVWNFGDPDDDVQDAAQRIYDVAGPAGGGVSPRSGTRLGEEGSPAAGERWWATDPLWDSIRYGLFAPSELSTTINVWPSDETLTTMWVQLVWHEADSSQDDLFPEGMPSEPVFEDLIPTPVDLPLLVEEVDLDHGWHHSTYTWNVAPSPEMISFVIRGRIVIDTLIIDSCTDRINVIHVDDNALNDPGPNDITISDPLENGTEDHPFDSIQEGINAALKGNLVYVHDGRYTETIDLSGKDITVKAQWLMDSGVYAPSIIDSEGASPVVRFADGETQNCSLAGLTITGSKGIGQPAILCEQSSPEISHCVITGNMNLADGGTIIACTDSTAKLINCTVTGNRAGSNSTMLTFTNSPGAKMLNSIVWGNSGSVLAGTDPLPSITFSDMEGGLIGPGILDADPFFADPGHWDDQGTPAVFNDDLWILGDYHLRSTQGRLDLKTEIWLLDDADSPCIDAGDPDIFAGEEPAPNGDRINIGVFGGTHQASKSIPNSF